jgi:hypothetical protein
MKHTSKRCIVNNHRTYKIHINTKRSLFCLWYDDMGFRLRFFFQKYRKYLVAQDAIFYLYLIQYNWRWGNCQLFNPRPAAVIMFSHRGR